MSEIEWREVEGFPDYEVSNTGLIRSHKRNRTKLLSPYQIGAGYLQVKLSNRGAKPCCRLVHQLVAHAFLPNPEGKGEVNHKSGNKTDNREGNIEWSTHAENMQHRSKRLGKNVGENHSNAKLTEAQVCAILADNRTFSEIAKDYPVSAATIRLIKAGKIWTIVSRPELFDIIQIEDDTMSHEEVAVVIVEDGHSDAPSI